MTLPRPPRFEPSEQIKKQSRDASRMVWIDGYMEACKKIFSTEQDLADCRREAEEEWEKRLSEVRRFLDPLGLSL